MHLGITAMGFMGEGFTKYRAELSDCLFLVLFLVGPRDDQFKSSSVPPGPRSRTSPYAMTICCQGFTNFVPKQVFARYLWKKIHFFVKRDHGPPAEGTARFDITRGTIVGRAAQNHARGAKCVLVAIDESNRSPVEALFISQGRIGP